MSIVPARPGRSRQAAEPEDGPPAQTSDFRSLSARGSDLQGWRSFAWDLVIMCAIVLGGSMLLALAFALIALTAWMAAAISAWTLVATVPLSIGLLLAAMLATYRCILG